MPQAAGSVTSLENLALACVSCSLRKGARTTAIDPTTGDAAQLFHPGLHVWSAHFIAEVSGEILGVTAIGRLFTCNDCAPRAAEALGSTYEAHAYLD